MCCFRAIVLACAFSIGLVGCGGNQGPADPDVKAELISMAPVAGGSVKLLMKVTNVSSQDIVRAKALVVVLDAEGNSLGTKSTYLIHGAKGGLAVGESVEEDAFVEVSDNTKAEGMSYEMQDIRFRN